MTSSKRPSTSHLKHPSHGHQAKLQADCESSFRTDTSATLREHVERAEKLEKTVLTKTEAENLSDAVASAVDAGIDGGDEFVKKSRKLLWNDAEYKLREQKMQQDIKQWKVAKSVL